MRYKEYLLSDFFDIRTTKSVDKSKVEFRNNAPYDFIGRTSTDWGVQGRLNRLEFAPNPKDSFSLVQVGETVALWRENEWYASQNLFILKPKKLKIKDVFLYFQAIINKEMSSYGNDYNSYPTMKSLNKTNILLPVKTTLVPDFESLEILAGGGIDMSNIDTSSWKEFKLGELFDIENTWVYGKNKQYHSQLKSKTVNSIAVVSGVTTNNGINYYTEDVLDDNEIYNDCLTISTRGEYSGSVFYHDYPFVLANNILAMPMPELSKEAKLFIATVIQALPFGGYGNYPTKDKLKEATIKLPVKESEEIDWDYMQERISELEQERISELEQYLIAAGLNDYELTDEDKEILATKLTDGGALQSSTSVNGCLKEARMFKVRDLFEIQKVTHKLSKEDLSEEYDYPTYSSDTSNNGIIGYSNNPEFLCNEITPAYLIFGDHTRTFNIARKSFSVIDNVKVFIPCSNSDDVLLYITTKWKKQIPNLGYARHWKIAKNCELFLPIQIDSQNNPIIDSTHMYHPHGYIPDWEYMEKYIKATEKIVIRDVVDWKNEMIEKTKEVVANRSDASQDIQPLDAQ